MEGLGRGGAGHMERKSAPSATKPGCQGEAAGPHFSMLKLTASLPLLGWSTKRLSPGLASSSSAARASSIAGSTSPSSSLRLRGRLTRVGVMQGKQADGR